MEFLNHANTPQKLQEQSKTPTLLSQGTYGCVYYPGFTCTGKLQKTNYISKLQKMSETVKNEIEIGEKIRQIKNHPYYFAPIISECPISIKKLQENFAQPLRECKIINEEEQTGGKGTKLIKQPKYKDTSEFEFSINKIKYILGEDLDKTFEEKKLATNTPKTEPITFLLDTYDYLSKSLQKLKSQNILHYDLKSNNIIYDKISNIPIIIDFGLSIQLDKINPQNPDPKIIYQYFFDTYEYDFWCLEPIFIGMYSKNIPSSETKENYNQQILSSLLKEKYMETIDNYINYVYIFKPEFITKLGQIFPTQSSIQQKIQNLPKTFYEKWHQYIKEHESDTNSTFFQTLWNARFTWDYYSLAVIYLEFISQLNLPPLNGTTTSRSELKKLKELELFTDFLLEQIVSLPHERKNK